MIKLGKLFAYLHVIRVYRNGDGYGFVWNFWNPVSWLFAPSLFLVAGFLEGFPTAYRNRYDFGFGIDPYFIDNPEQLEWV